MADFCSIDYETSFFKNQKKNSFRKHESIQQISKKTQRKERQQQRKLKSKSLKQEQERKSYLASLPEEKPFDVFRDFDVTYDPDFWIEDDLSGPKDKNVIRFLMI